MKGFLLPLYCLAILGPQLRGAVANDTATDMKSVQPATTGSSNPMNLSTHALSSSAPTTAPATNPTNPSTTNKITVTSTPVTNGLYELLFISECRPVTLVSCGLILVCAILLIFTLMLACKVCRLSRRLRMLDSSFDLFSSSENCAATAKQAANAAEAKETTVLLSDMGRAREDLANGAPKEEEGGQAKEGGPESKKAAGGGADSEQAPTGENKQEAPVAAAKQPQEDVATSQSEVAAASSSEGAEEPKDVV